MKRVLLMLLVLCFVCEAQSQTRKLHFGIQGLLTMRNNSFLAGYNPDRLNLRTKNQSAWGYGAFTSYDVSNSVALRLSPYLIRETDVFQWTEHDPQLPIITTTKTKKQDYLFFNIPAHALLKLGEAKQFYFLTGGTYYNAVDTKTEDPVVTLSNYDITADIGLGYAIGVGKLSITPEFKYAFAVIDAEQGENTGMRYYRNRVTFTILVSY